MPSKRRQKMPEFVSIELRNVQIRQGDGYVLRPVYKQADGSEFVMVRTADGKKMAVAVGGALPEGLFE